MVCDSGMGDLPRCEFMTTERNMRQKEWNKNKPRNRTIRELKEVKQKNPKRKLNETLDRKVSMEKQD